MYRRIVVFCIICSLCLCGCTSAEYTVYSDAQGVTTSTSVTDADTEETVYYEFLDIPTDADETIYTTKQRNPHVTMYLEADVYEPDGAVKFHIIDPTNMGFISDQHLALWGWDGKEWIKERRVSLKYTPSIYKGNPNPDGTPIDIVDTIYLSNYKDIQRGKRYKITIGVEGYTLSQEFTVAAE